MNSRLTKGILILSGAVLYNAVFWGEGIGLNLLLFSVFWVGSTLFVFPEARKSKAVLGTGLGALVAASMVVVHHTGISMFATLSSLLLMTGFALQSSLRTLHTSTFTTIVNYVLIPVGIAKNIGQVKNSSKVFRVIWNVIRLVVLPAAVLVIFYVLYKTASPEFDELTDNAGNWIYETFQGLFENFPVARFFFLLSGFLIMYGALVNMNYDGTKSLEDKPDILTRIRKGLPRSRRFVRQIVDGQAVPPPMPANAFVPAKPRYKSNALTTELKRGLIILGSLNALILLVNSLDVYYLWFNFNPDEVKDFTQLVHTGTYFLIFSILLAMGILLWFFRGNLNFYKDNKLLKIFALIWMGQNAVMVITVFVKNSHYIGFFGLAYNRIGMLAFLTLTMFGIITLSRKVFKKHSLSYLFRVNSWAVYAVMLAMCFVNWDRFIANYNLASEHQEGYMNVPFMLHLSDKTLDIIDQNRHILEYKPDEIYHKMHWGSGSLSSRSRYRLSPEYYRSHLDNRIDNFIREEAEQSWLSWNLAEANALEYFRVNSWEMRVDSMNSSVDPSAH